MKVVFCSSALLQNKKGQILLMSRKNKDVYKNYWEFPGGKLHNGETFITALKRELDEELNLKIEIKNLKNPFFTKHHYKSFILMMYTFILNKWKGDIINKDKEKLIWVNKSQLKKIKLLPANVNIVNYLVK